MNQKNKGVERRPDHGERELERIRALYERSLTYKDSDPETFLMYSRKCAEAICKNLFIDEISPNAGNLTLEPLLEKLNTAGVLPKAIALPLRTIQSYGNFGAHHQDDAEAISPEYIQPCVHALAVVAHWYFTGRKTAATRTADEEVQKDPVTRISTSTIAALDVQTALSPAKPSPGQAPLDPALPLSPDGTTNAAQAGTATAPKSGPEPQIGRSGRSIEWARIISLTCGTLALVAGTATSWWMDSKVAENNSTSIAAQRLFSWGMQYQRLVTLSAFHLEPGNVFLVEISSRDAVSDRNTCQERDFIGNVLKILARAQPTVVVIDKYFENVRCDGGTLNLIAGVKSLCDSKVRVIVGRGVNDEALKSEMKQYPLDPALDFRKEGAACVDEGLLNMDPDFRRVSLWFPGVQPVAYSNAEPPSLPLAAALAFKPDLTVSNWGQLPDPPYVSFLEPRQFQKFKRGASEVLHDGNEDWFRLARGKVVVIGETDPHDYHQTVLGGIDGYMLQANYIEALISGRVFRSAGALADFLGGLSIYVLFVCFPRNASRPKRLAWDAALVCGVALTIGFAVNLSGYYFNPIPVAVLSLLYTAAFKYLWTRLSEIVRLPAARP